MVFLIIILFTVQLLPAVQSAPEYFDSNTAAEGLQIHSNSLQNTVPLLDNNSARHAYQKIPTRKSDSSVIPFMAMPVNLTETAMPGQITDVRSRIREKITQYFNGSKYKADPLNS